jgi:protein-disulfide isomerase
MQIDRLKSTKFVSLANAVAQLGIMLVGFCALLTAQVPTIDSETKTDEVLRPPKDAKLALVEFVDFQCPNCASYNPIIAGIVQKYKLPWIRRDFPIPTHAWSFQAAVNARWFDQQSSDLGNQYRDAVFAEQRRIDTLKDLEKLTTKFAELKNILVPANVDPTGAIAKAVREDYTFAHHLGIHHVPTVFLVMAPTDGGPSSQTEVKDLSQLSEMIEQSIKLLSEAPPSCGCDDVPKKDPANGGTLRQMRAPMFRSTRTAQMLSN